MEKTKKFTILHSNDMHGDFLAEIQKDSTQAVGGLSLLSGYINEVRKTEKNVIFTVSGDMVQGSLIDSVYKGISTVEIMNYLSPDVASLGNHELDYGLPHLLFLEKMANFPIVNANMYIKKYHKRLLQPYVIQKIDDFDILFIGIVTETVLQTLKRDSQISLLINLEDAAKEIGKICDAYKNDDIDLTILLTHIGLENDKALASLLDPNWGVDMILGGHSHTFMEKPEVVNNILIAQSGWGTDQIGRFDIVVDDDTNSISEWTWSLVPINESSAQKDQDLEEFIESFQKPIDNKYNSIVGRISKKLTHPKREMETSLGDFMADALIENDNCDICLVGSGSIRIKEFGPIITLGTITKLYPFEDSLQRFLVTGEHLYKIFNHFLRPENRGEDGEFYQISHGVRVSYSDELRKIISFSLNGNPIEKDHVYYLGIQGYHVLNCEDNLNITKEELTQKGGQKVIATSIRSVLEEYFQRNQNIPYPKGERMLFV